MPRRDRGSKLNKGVNLSDGPERFYRARILVLVHMPDKPRNRNVESRKIYEILKVRLSDIPGLEARMDKHCSVLRDPSQSGTCRACGTSCACAGRRYTIGSKPPLLAQRDAKQIPVHRPFYISVDGGVRAGRENAWGFNRARTGKDFSGVLGGQQSQRWKLGQHLAGR